MRVFKLPGFPLILLLLGVSSLLASGEETQAERASLHWSLIPPESHPVPRPALDTWASRPLDKFILAKLEEEGMKPSPDADPVTLLRRLHFDLVGLSPAPDQVDKFLAKVEEEGLDAAMSEVVDQLLAMPQFGERWGRHWLDVARFAESSGKDSNFTFPHAWRYRDYVIDSINADTGFDRFLIEQLAGDLLPYESDEERARNLIATGFLALGPKGLNEMNRIQFIADVIDEQIDTTTRAILATSVACARCHDHKTDPYTMEDYYALAGIFLSTKTYFGTAVGPDNVQGGELIRLPDLPDQVIPNKSIPPQKFKELNETLAALKAEEVERKAKAAEAVKNGENPEKYFSLQDALRIIWQSGGIEGQLRTVDSEGNAIPLCMGVLDHDEGPQDAPILDRGEITKPGEKIPRGFPEAITIEGAAPPADEQSGRLELAQWIASPRHPLTARVITNRIWHNLFGTGIVSTVDDFGVTGSPPSHPELLDHLSLALIHSGWSLKSLVREIVLSRTYRQDSTFRKDCFDSDPENRLLWRMSKRRLDAECIRDAMLEISGTLDLERPEASHIAPLGDRSVALFAFSRELPSDLDGVTYRSVYLPVARDRLPDALDLFDCAEPSLVTGSRDITNVPVQSLYLLNSEFMHRTSTAFAERLRAEHSERDEQVQFAYRLCFLHSPGEAEKALADRFFADYPADGSDPLASFCQALLSTARFRNLD